MEHPIFPIIHQLCKTKKEEYSRSFRNTSMLEALTILAKSTKDYRINFMYDELEDFTVPQVS